MIIWMNNFIKISASKLLKVEKLCSRKTELWTCQGMLESSKWNETLRRVLFFKNWKSYKIRNLPFVFVLFLGTTGFLLQTWLFLISILCCWLLLNLLFNMNQFHLFHGVLLSHKFHFAFGGVRRTLISPTSSLPTFQINFYPFDRPSRQQENLEILIHRFMKTKIEFLFAKSSSFLIFAPKSTLSRLA